jgi:hypothetical protein
MYWEDDDRVGAHWVLPGSGTWHPVVRLGERIFRAAPVTLPWAPEFEPAPAREGQALLQAVAKAGGGVERLAIAGLFGEAIASEGGLFLAPWLVALAVLLVICEVLTRRFLASPRVQRARPKESSQAPAVAIAHAQPLGAVGPTTSQAPQETHPATPVATSTPPKAGVQSALSAARARAKKRTGQ